MSTHALLVVVGVAIALTVLAGLWLFRSRPFVTDPAPESWGADPDDRQWNDEAVSIWHTELSDVRGVAEKWSGTVAALLAIFGAVAFATGPSALTDIPGDDAYVVLGLVVLAVLVAAASTYCAALAAQGSPTVVGNLNGWTLKRFYTARLPGAMQLLRASRFLALAAVLLVVGAVAIGWLAALDGRDSQSAESAVVIRLAGGSSCGELKRLNKRLVLVSANGVIVPLANVRSVTIVDSCP
jgi:hypothetical protein